MLRSRFQEFQTQLRQLNSKHTLETSLRLQRARHAQSVLSARLIHLVARLHQLTPLRGSPIRAEEESLASALDACVRGMGGRGVESSTMQDKVNELWVLIAQKKARRSALAEEEERMAEWAVSNESEALKVLQVRPIKPRHVQVPAKNLVFGIRSWHNNNEHWTISLTSFKKMQLCST